jgi:preprotein translocase subunit SecD
MYHPPSMRRAGPILILVIGLLALIVDFYPRLTLPNFGPEGGTRRVETKLGLDLEGGVRVEYQAMPVGDKVPDTAALNTIREIVEQRVNSSGVSEPVVTTSGSDRVVVELPGVENAQAIRDLIGQTGQLAFVPIPDGAPTVSEGQTIEYPALFTGEQIESATVGSDQFGQRAVDFVLRSEGARLFGDYTTNNVGKQFAITLDRNVISAPVIRSPIPGGHGQITGNFSLQEAQDLVRFLDYGSLPFPIRELSELNISPTLGEEFLHRSLLAGSIAIFLVVMFMVVHYRLPGLVAAFALLYYSLVVYAIFRVVPVTLTLAGIAGFVLSVGMAVDANILIFERMKEELRAGKSLPAAVEAGFARAWTSILDSNVSSLITAMILYLFGSSVIRGFALVLIIGVLVSMFSAITVTRTILRVIVQQDRARRARLYGVGEDEFTARPSARPMRGEARGRV